MKPSCNVATLIERYFSERLMRQRNVSANTIASYRDTFRLLFTFAQARLRKPPSALALGELDAPFISAFLITPCCCSRYLDLGPRQEMHLTLIVALARYREDSLDNGAVGRLLEGREPEEGADGRQAQVARPDDGAPP